jgi:hypothetical protein
MRSKHLFDGDGTWRHRLRERFGEVADPQSYCRAEVKIGQHFRGSRVVGGVNRLTRPPRPGILRAGVRFR